MPQEGRRVILGVSSYFQKTPSVLNMSWPYIVTQKAFSTMFPALPLLNVDNLNVVQIRPHPMISVPPSAATGPGSPRNLQSQYSSQLLLRSHDLTAVFQPSWTTCRNLPWEVRGLTCSHLLMHVEDKATWKHRERLSQEMLKTPYSVKQKLAGHVHQSSEHTGNTSVLPMEKCLGLGCLIYGENGFRQRKENTLISSFAIQAQSSNYPQTLEVGSCLLKYVILHQRLFSSGLSVISVGNQKMRGKTINRYKPQSGCETGQIESIEGMRQVFITKSEASPER